MDTDEMLARLGNEATEELVHENFDGQSRDEIAAEINTMFPYDDNDELIDKVYKFTH